MFPSQMPIHITSPCSARAYATASFAPRSSGSETISSSGVPARLRSTPVMPWESSCSSLPASSSRWARVSRTRLSSPSTKNFTSPPATIGSSYWLIW